MLPLGCDQKHSEKTFTLKKDLAGDFDDTFGLGEWRKKLWIADFDRMGDEPMENGLAGRENGMAEADEARANDIGRLPSHR